MKSAALAKFSPARTPSAALDRKAGVAKDGTPPPSFSGGVSAPGAQGLLFGIVACPLGMEAGLLVATLIGDESACRSTALPRRGQDVGV